jgi:hypothetical protein
VGFFFGVMRRPEQAAPAAEHVMISPLTLNYVRTGSRGNAPVVLLHSAGLDLTYLDALDAPGTEHDVIAFDLPGHGRSEGKEDSITTDHMTEAPTTTMSTLVGTCMSRPPPHHYVRQWFYLTLLCINSLSHQAWMTHHTNVHL